MSEKLKSFIGDFQRAPFLFIGSGLSRRYLNLEDWTGLLKKFCEVIDKDYQYYYSSAEKDLTKVASLLASDLHDKWWNEPAFEKSRKKYKDLCQDRESALKIEISHYINGATSNLTNDVNLLEEIRLLKNVVVDGVITTNWDNFLEKIFKDFKTYIGQNELIFSSPQGIGEIYKIHGCCSNPNSLVLTNRDYENFNKRNPYLAAKLLTIFTEHPIIFLGYSVSDENILTILDSISSCLTSENIKKLQDRLIFVQWDKNVEETLFGTHTISVDAIRIPVKTITINSYIPLFNALCSIERKFPARLLRQLKEHVYELVASNEAGSKLYVQNIDDDNQNIKDLEVVFGVGAIGKVAGAGYKRFGRVDLINDLISDRSAFDPTKIVDDTLTELLKNTKLVPFFKYITSCEYFESPTNFEHADQRINQHFKEAIRKSYYNANVTAFIKRKEEIFNLNLNLQQFVDKYGFKDFLKFFCFINEENYNEEDLLAIISKNISILNNSDENEKTQFYRLICFYDWFKYYYKLIKLT